MNIFNSIILLLFSFIIYIYTVNNTKYIKEHLQNSYAPTYLYTRYGNKLDSKNRLIDPGDSDESWEQRVNPDTDGDGIISNSERAAYSGNVKRSGFDTDAIQNTNLKNDCSLLSPEEEKMRINLEKKVNSLSGNKKAQNEALKAQKNFEKRIKESREMCENMKKNQ